MSRSSAWEKLMISTRECAARSVTAACTGAECSVCTSARRLAGKTSSRLSIQCTRTGNGASADDRARRHTAAEQRDRHAARVVVFSELVAHGGHIGAADALETKLHHAAAALAERRTEREVARASMTAPASARLAIPDCLELELAAANGADRIAVGKHRHPGPTSRGAEPCVESTDRRLARQPFEQRLDQRPLHGLGYGRGAPVGHLLGHELGELGAAHLHRADAELLERLTIAGSATISASALASLSVTSWAARRAGDAEVVVGHQLRQAELDHGGHVGHQRRARCARSRPGP